MTARETCIALSTVPQNGQTCIASSTIARPRRGQLPRPEKNSFGVARANKTQFAIALVDPRIAELDRRRASAGLSHQRLCADARVHPRTWFYLRHGEQTPKPKTLERLETAVARAVPKPKVKTPALAALVRAVEALVAGAIARDRALFEAVTYRRNNVPQPSDSDVARRVRTLALYVAAVEVEAGNAAIAASLGMTRANVHKARGTIEELADNPLVRAMLDAIAALLRGEGP